MKNCLRSGATVWLLKPTQQPNSVHSSQRFLQRIMRFHLRYGKLKPFITHKTFSRLRNNPFVRSKARRQKIEFRSIQIESFLSRRRSKNSRRRWKEKSSFCYLWKFARKRFLPDWDYVKLWKDLLPNEAEMWKLEASYMKATKLIFIFKVAHSIQFYGISPPQPKFLAESLWRRLLKFSQFGERKQLNENSSFTAGKFSIFCHQH